MLDKTVLSLVCFAHKSLQLLARMRGDLWNSLVPLGVSVCETMLGITINFARKLLTFSAIVINNA